MFEEGVKGVGLGLALPVVGRLIARGADGYGGLGQAKGQRLPCERVLAEEVAQMTRGVVELEEGGGGDLGEERFEDGGIGGDDGFEEAERGVVCSGVGHCRGRGCGYGCGGERVAGPYGRVDVLLLRGHEGASRDGGRRESADRDSRGMWTCTSAARGLCRAGEDGRVSEAWAGRGSVSSQ